MPNVSPGSADPGCIASVDTRRKSAPFREGYCPIRSITDRHSLSPASFTPWSIPLPCGRDTICEMGAVGLTQLISMEKCRGEVGPYSPVGHTGVAASKDRSDGPSHIAFWLRPVSLFGRFGVTSPASLHDHSTFHVSPGRRSTLRLAETASLSPELHTLDYSAACPGRGTSTPEGPGESSTSPPALQS